MIKYNELIYTLLPNYNGLKNLLKHQVQFIEDSSDQCIWIGGVGSGKTLTGCLKVLDLAYNVPDNFILVGCQTYRMLQDTTKRTMLELLDNAEGYIRYQEIKSENKIIVYNNHKGYKSEIIFRHLQDEGKLKGLNLGALFVDELTEVKRKIWNQLLMRLRRNKKNFAFATSNSDHPSHWVYKRYIEPYKDRYTDGDIKTDSFRIIIAPTITNIFLPEQYKLFLKDLSEEDYNRYALAQWTEIEGLIYGKCFNRNENVITDMDAQKYKFQVKNLIYCISIDPSYHNFAIGHYLIDTNKKNVIKIDESMHKEIELSDIWQSLYQKIKINENKYNVKYNHGYIDTANQQTRLDLESLSNNKLRLKNSYKDIADGIITVRKYLQSRRFLIVDKCTNTIKDINSYKYKYNEKLDMFIDEPAKDQYDPHHMDEARYLLHTMYGYKVDSISSGYFAAQKREAVND